MHFHIHLHAAHLRLVDSGIWRHVALGATIFEGSDGPVVLAMQLPPQLPDTAALRWSWPIVWQSDQDLMCLCQGVSSYADPQPS